MRAVFPALIVALALLAGMPFAGANPFFARQTGQPCMACHQPGQEQRGASGLNSTGLAFKNCGETPGCFGAPSSPQSFIKTTATQGACRGGAELDLREPLRRLSGPSLTIASSRWINRPSPAV